MMLHRAGPGPGLRFAPSGLRISAVSSHFLAAIAFNLPGAVVDLPRFRCKGISMLTEASYLSRFFAKFVEIIAAGLATAFSAYVIAYLGGSLSTPMPPPSAVSAGATALDVAKSPPAQPAPSVAGAAVAEQ